MQIPPNWDSEHLKLVNQVLQLLVILAGIVYAVYSKLKDVEDKEKALNLTFLLIVPVLLVVSVVALQLNYTTIGFYGLLLTCLAYSIDYVRRPSPAERKDTLMLVLLYTFTVSSVSFYETKRIVDLLSGIVHILERSPH
jgi:hypothetical protein